MKAVWVIPTHRVLPVQRRSPDSWLIASDAVWSHAETVRSLGQGKGRAGPEPGQRSLYKPGSQISGNLNHGFYSFTASIQGDVK